MSGSLSVECALYLAFGLGAILAVALPRWRYKPLGLAVAFFTLGTILIESMWSARDLLQLEGWSDSDWMTWAFYISPYAVVLQFGIGVATYKLSTLTFRSSWSKLCNDVGAVGLILTYMLLATDQIRDSFNIGMFASLATAAVMIGARATSIFNRLLSGRAIVYVGTVSYSLYLFHFMIPPLALHNRSFDVFDTTAAAYHAVNFASSFALAIIFATGVYHLVEVPGRRTIRAAADRLPQHSTADGGTRFACRIERASTAAWALQPNCNLEPREGKAGGSTAAWRAVVEVHRKGLRCFGT